MIEIPAALAAVMGFLSIFGILWLISEKKNTKSFNNSEMGVRICETKGAPSIKEVRAAVKPPAHKSIEELLEEINARLDKIEQRLDEVGV